MICAYDSVLDGLREVRDLGLTRISCSDRVIWVEECTPTLHREMSTLGTLFRLQPFQSFSQLVIAYFQSVRDQRQWSRGV